MSLIIRDANQDDFKAILKLNQDFVHFTSEMDINKLTQMHEQSAYHRVACFNDEVAGFLLVFDQAADYSSDNFTWFKHKYEAFFYIDRIVVNKSMQGHGIGGSLYLDLFEYIGSGLVCCEYNAKPANLGSAAFHHKLDFEQVGERAVSGAKLLSMQAKRF